MVPSAGLEDAQVHVEVNTDSSLAACASNAPMVVDSRCRQQNGTGKLNPLTCKAVWQRIESLFLINFIACADCR